MHIKCLQITFWLLCVITVGHLGNVITKCCPANGQLSHVAEYAPHYKCTATLSSQLLTGYNIQIPPDDEDRIPDCAQPASDQDKPCFDELNDQTVVLKCSGQLPEAMPTEVLRVSKCCPPGFIYDLGDRQCRSSLLHPDIKNGALAKLLSSSDLLLLNEVQTPECHDEIEVFVEYLSGGHRLSLRAGGDLEVVAQPHGEAEHLPAGSFCVEVATEMENDTTLADDLVASSEVPQLIIRTCRPRSICKRIACVRRCCRNEQMLERQDGISMCVPLNRNIRPTFHDVQLPLVADRPPAVADVAEYGLIHVQTCQRFILDASFPEDVHYINRDGRLHVAAYAQPFSQNDYCVENFNDSGTVQFETFVCFPDHTHFKFLYYPIGLIISTLFLWVTLLVYILLPKLLNLHGKTLVCYVCSLLIAYTSLAVTQFHVDTRIENCFIVAYVIYFGFLASFCWQSVMCFDIWWTFGSNQITRGMQKQKQLRRFLLYSLYAWGVPILLTNITVQFDLNDWLEYEWSPNLIQDNQCWFENDRGVHYALPLFFLLPIGMHIVTNTVLFTLTIRHCNKVKNEIHRMQAASDERITHKAKKRFAANRNQLLMNGKLFCVMGVSWLLEVVGTLFRRNSVLWYFTDTFNILQGVLVFLIFVCKWKVWHELKLRFGWRSTKGAAVTNSTSTGRQSSQQPDENRLRQL